MTSDLEIKAISACMYEAFLCEKKPCKRGKSAFQTQNTNRVMPGQEWCKKRKKTYVKMSILAFG